MRCPKETVSQEAQTTLADCLLRSLRMPTVWPQKSRSFCARVKVLKINFEKVRTCGKLMEGKVLIGAETLVSIANLCVLQITGKIVTAHTRGWKHTFDVQFDTVEAARCCYDTLLLDLKRAVSLPFQKMMLCLHRPLSTSITRRDGHQGAFFRTSMWASAQ